MRIDLFHDSSSKDMDNESVRALLLQEELKKRSHKVELNTDRVLINDLNVLFIDHKNAKRVDNLILHATNNDIGVVLFDGGLDETEHANISVSPFYNNNSDYKGLDYLVLPKYNAEDRYSVDNSGSNVFVSMEKYDDLVEVLEVLQELDINAVVTKIQNYKNLKKKFKNIGFCDTEDYYNAMHECSIAITTGDMVFKQTLHYGLPTIVLPKDDIQEAFVKSVNGFCFPMKHINKVYLKDKVEGLMENEYKRYNTSMFSKNKVDGNGCSRVCDLIEKMA